MSEADRSQSILPKLHLDIRLAKLARPQEAAESCEECEHREAAADLSAESAC